MPHDGHAPCVAGLPFFMVMLLGSFISFLARHLTQYACIGTPPFFTYFTLSLHSLLFLAKNALPPLPHDG